MSIRSCFISQPKNKLVSNNEQSFNATDFLPLTFGITQISPGTKDENKNSKAHTTKILSYSGTSASTIRRDVLHEPQTIYKRKKY